MRIFATKKFYSPQSIAFGSGATAVLPQGLELKLPIDRIDLIFTGRVVVAQSVAGNFTPEPLANFLKNVQVYGSHIKKGNIVLINASGAELYQRATFLLGSWPRHIGITRLAATTAATFDFQLCVPIPLTFRPGHKSEMVGTAIAGRYQTLINPDDWSTLQLQVTFNTYASATPAPLIAGGTITSTTYTAFGSGSGNPTLNYLLYQAILNKKNPSTHYIQYLSRHSNLGGVVGNVTRGLVSDFGDFPYGTRLKSYMIRQYDEVASNPGVVAQSGTTSSFLARPTTTETGVTRVYSMRDYSFADWDPTWDKLQDIDRDVFTPHNGPNIASIDDIVSMPNGYAMVDYTAESGNMDDAFDLRAGYPPHKQNLFVDSSGTAATNRQDVSYESVVAI